MARTGRPRSENPKHRIISMRMSDQEYREVREFASKHNLTVSETLLQGFNNLKSKRCSRQNDSSFFIERKEYGKVKKGS